MSHTLIEKLLSNVQGDEFYLLKVSIGPVQEFISEARKTRDLYMGSLLLSQITSESMRPICDAYGPEAIIYPYMGDSSSHSVSIPNMYMAVIPKNDLNLTIKEMECHILGLWNNVVKEVSKKLPSGCTKEYEHWMRQIGNHFYMNWVAVPITSGELEKSYRPKVQDIQRFLDERKMTRTFDAWKGENAQKCVQCAHREGMSGDFFSKLRRKKEFNTKIKENEILCGVCLLKRLVKTKNVNINFTEPGFESVVDVSAGTFKQLINRNKTQEVVWDFLKDVNKIKSLLEEKTVDKIEELSGEWYYKDNLSIEFLQKEYGVDKSELLGLSTKAQKTLDEVYKLIKRTPSKYYAIVNMDGDDMGKVMSGKSLDDNTFTVDYHNTLSKTLAKTAATTSDLIKDKGNGLCVYSGGDDLLAFLPIEEFLPTINEARFSFSDEFKLIDETLTSSAGIVLLHYHDPLRRGLKEANDNVKKAKELFRQKDAFFITLRIFSGTVITWGSQWTIKNFAFKKDIVDPIQVLDVVKTFVSFMTMDQKNRLSSNFVRDLMKELPVFYKWNKYYSKWSFNSEMFKAEFKRLLKRHIPAKSDLWKPEKITLLELTTEIFAYMADPDKNEQIHNTNDFTKDNFEQFLQISLFLAKELTRDCN